MTRGRYPKKAIRKAKKIAEERGEVRCYARNHGLHPHFSIVAPHLLAEVILKITKHISAPLAQMEAEAAEEIGCMKMYPASQQISREIWFSSQNYFRRYFRITGTGLIELGPEGNLLPIDLAKLGTGPTTGAPAPAAAVAGSQAAGSPGSPGAQQFPAPEYLAVQAPAPAVPVPESSGPASTAPASLPESPAPADSPASPAPVAREETNPSPAHPARGTPDRRSVHT